jgi:hypothetical protein
MPVYIFQNPKTKEYKEVFLALDAEKVYHESGVKWQRIFLAPNVSVDTQIDANSEQDFVEKTKRKNYNLGEMWDASKDLSEKREKERGVDPVKEKSLKEYSKKRRGAKHTNRVVL